MPYRVFVGAPTSSFLLENNSENATYEWRTVSSSDVKDKSTTTVSNNNTTSLNSSTSAGTSNNSFLIPHETYEAASSRISEFYQNTIFHDDDDDEQDHDAAGNNQTTVLTWPPTAPAAEISHNQVPSFLLHDNDDTSVHWDQIETLRSPPSSLSDSDYTRSRLNAGLASRSIAQFPSFHFNPNTLSSLSQLMAAATGPQKKTVINILVAVLDVDPRSGTDTVKIKNGADAGKEVAVLRMIVGDEDGRVAKLTAWRDVAELWGGAQEDGEENPRRRHSLTGEALKRGDIVLIESVFSYPSLHDYFWLMSRADVNGSKDAKTLTPVLVASPYLSSRLTICYRTLPREDGDQRWRPDLRLGATDAAVRKVAAVVRWFENMAGL
ncbi:hypothetical protein JOM56_006827 [Amanita muscaria]